MYSSPCQVLNRHVNILTTQTGISKLSGQAKAATYPQPEGTLGETMVAYGRKLGEESVFGEEIVKPAMPSTNDCQQDNYGQLDYERIACKG